MNSSTFDRAVCTSYTVHSKPEQKVPDGILKLYLKEYSKFYMTPRQEGKILFH